MYVELETDPATVEITLESAYALHVEQTVLAQATTISQGKVELATSAETIAGTDAERAVTPAGLAAALTDKKTGLVLTTVNAATHTLSADEVAGAVNILHVTYTDTGSVVITIPTAVITSGEWTLFVKDADFNANTNNITIQTEGAETIDEGATYVMQYDGMSLSIYCDGSNLFIM